jgi:biopolymer transport protein TolQ
MQLATMDNLKRAVRKAQFLESDRLASSISILATTGSATPFIGLFGTVWGIMASFQSIGERGSASLAVVAPGISEALVATAAFTISSPTRLQLSNPMLKVSAPISLI